MNDEVKTPKDWMKKRIKDLYYVKGRIGWRGLKKDDFTESGPYLITGQDIINDEIQWENCFHIPMEKYLESPEIMVGKNDIIMTKDGTIGKLALLKKVPEEKASLNAHLFLIRNLEGNRVLPYYTYYKLQSQDFKKYIASRSVGATRLGFSQSEFEKYVFYLPPLFEQRGIAEILRTVDECVSLTDAVIKMAEDLKRGLMQRLLTNGIGHTEYKETPLGMIPETWDIVPLKKHIKIQSGNYFKYEEFVPEGVRVLKIDNVSYNEIIWDTITYLPREYLYSFSELSLIENDIIIALNRPITNNKLKLGIIKNEDTPSILYQRVGRLITRNPLVLNPKFLYYYMSTGYFMNDLRRIFRGTDQPYVNPTEIVTLKIPIPPKKEQEKTVQIIESQETLIDFEKKKYNQLTQVKQGLMQILLSGNIRVELKGDALHRIQNGIGVHH